jgi:hypothetical protein
MDKVNDKLWHAFKHLAEQYPDDHGVRMTSDLARWLIEEQQRQRLLGQLRAVSETTMEAAADVGSPPLRAV